MTISQLVLEVEIYKSIKRESTFESLKEKSWMSELTIIDQQSLKGSVVNQTSHSVNYQPLYSMVLIFFSMLSVPSYKTGLRSMLSPLTDHCLLRNS